MIRPFPTGSKRRGLAGKRLAAMAVASGLLLAAPGGAALADDESATLRSASTTQMNSVPEVVFVNSYADAEARVTNFNTNWKFKLGDTPGAEAQIFDDSTWDNITVPHDYSIDQDYTRSGEAESAFKPGGVGWYRKTFQLGSELDGKRVRLDFDGVYMDATVYVNGEQVATHPYGYSPFQVDITDQVKIGAENSVAVRVNNQVPSSRWYSGSGIGRDVDLVVTDPIHIEGNGVSVFTPNLNADNAANVPTSITANVRNNSEGDASVTLVQSIFEKGGDPANAIGSVTTDAQNVAAGATAQIESELTASNPTLWSPESPALYTVRTEVQVDGKTVDTFDTDFGFRYFSFDANEGFFLNGQKVKLKGVSMHHDQGALGSVSTRAAIERQVRILKEMGINSIRSTHNPPSRELVEVCNAEGILLISEFFDGWNKPKNSNRYDYARFFDAAMDTGSLIGAAEGKTWAQFDLEQSIARDINAPSIIMWSLGNEVTEGTTGVPGYVGIQQNLINWTKAMDPTRPVTDGDNKKKGGSNEMHPQGIADADGINGFNYMKGSQYDSVHSANPTWKIYGAETASAVNSRGIYNVIGNRQDAGGQQLTSYDYSAVPWGHPASEAWFDTITRDFVAGEYVWTGFDYLGEPTPWNGVTAGVPGNAKWPAPKNSFFGIIDTAGLPKDSFYFYQSQWNDSKNTLHILPAWNENVVYKDRNGNVPVVVYSDAPAVELFFTPTGSSTPQSLGKKDFTTKTTDGGYEYQIYEGDDKSSTEHENLYLRWNVPFNEGTITAKAYDADGNELDTSAWEGRQSVTTTGAASKLAASVDRPEIQASGTDLAYVHVRVTDADGNVVPDAANKVTFNVDGEGTLVGVDNGSSPDHQSYRDNNRKAHAGELVAIVQSTKEAGNFTVTATADGLEPASVSVTTTEVADGAEGAAIDSFKYSRHVYLKTGSTLELPDQVEARYTDGSVKTVPATWESLTEEQLATPGTYTVSGEAEGIAISVIVNVIDGVAALLNYSTTSAVGAVPSLPDSRPAVLPNGDVSKALFPVAWEMPEDSAFGTEGTVVVDGTANVFGEDLTVTASVRVQAEAIQIGKNIAADALDLTQSVDPSEQSDTLEAVRDGSTAHDPNTAGGPNPSAWSNWQASQNGKDEADLTFVYATQQRFGEIKVFFFQDTASARWPEPNTTSIEISEDGNTWTPVEASETIGEANERVKPYTYTFTPVGATYVRLHVKNSTEPTGTQWRACTGITEIELKVAQGSFSTFDTAALDSLKVNGKAVSEAALESGSYSTRALSATVEAVGKDNTAVTVLPQFEDKIKILLESEDNSKLETFVINLAQDADAGDLPVDDDSRDYPVEKITPSAASEQPINAAGTEGPASLAFDKLANTLYHSNWQSIPDFSTHSLTMQLEEPAKIEALRYLPRQDGNVNGSVTQYRVEYSNDGNEWQTAGEGSWDNPQDKSWRIAKFEPVTAQHFRLIPVHTAGEGAQQDRFFSASEIRLRMAPETIDISDEALVEITVPAEVTVDRVDADNPVLYPELAAAGFQVRLLNAETTDVEATPMASRAAEDGTLVYGVDYLLSFEGNESAGDASVTIEGIEDFSGIVTRPFVIKVKEAEVTGLAVKTPPTKSIYEAGEMLDPTGLVLTLTYSDGLEEEVTYSEDAGFEFVPALNEALVEGTNSVLVSYAGHEATFSITVKPETTDPTDPTEPSEPTEPTDPSGPTEPTDPSEPTEPSEPSEPTEPSEPSEPGEPTDPGEPSEPTEPGTPTDPTTPSQPGEPNAPTATEPGTGSDLPRTGVEVLPLALLGGALAAVGISAVVIRRRKEI